MSEPAAHRININLNRKSKEKLDNVFYKWAINVGRILILVTELIALLALFYRFVIDRQIIDLHDLIKKEESFVSAQAAQEKEFREIQDKLAIIKAVKLQTDLKIKVMNDILQAVNDNTFSSSNLTIDKNTISVDGITDSIFLLESFVEKMKQYPEVNSISIDQINSTPQGVLFKLDIQLRNEMEKYEKSNT